MVDFWYDIRRELFKEIKMEFFRKHRKIIVIFLSISVIAWMVGIGALFSVL